MVLISEILSFENPLFRTYIFHGSVLGLKVLSMATLTASAKYLKVKKHAVANPEDASGKAIVRVDEDVERVRRAHLNDLENIPIYLVVSGLYLLTGPSVCVATHLMRAYTVARVAHTFVYAVCVIPQPARALTWGVGYGITIYMAVNTLLAFKAGI